ncbi:unnamed protein product [Protopolystoma xenopodis]|uniref:Uncharacterized protein n=1 Tax=Protopolystoma xenopodis TaxID=117903 RepID=A0A3S5CKX1_9PLAT|nr:unnamed protein product [Protopolystoma xenopodis]
MSVCPPPPPPLTEADIIADCGEVLAFAERELALQQRDLFRSTARLRSQHQRGQQVSGSSWPSDADDEPGENINTSGSIPGAWTPGSKNAMPSEAPTGSIGEEVRSHVNGFQEQVNACRNKILDLDQQIQNPRIFFLPEVNDKGKHG